MRVKANQENGFTNMALENVKSKLDFVEQSMLSREKRFYCSILF